MSVSLRDGPRANIWRRTEQLRWLRSPKTTTQSDTLQQAWINERGELHWSDIPVHIEGGGDADDR